MSGEYCPLLIEENLAQTEVKDLCAALIPSHERETRKAGRLCFALSDRKKLGSVAISD